MVSLSLVVLALVAAVGATDVQQCPKRSFQGLSENVQLSPCKKPPCRLRKKTKQEITINFVPEKDLTDVVNHVEAVVLGLSLPFVGVNGNSICDKIYLENGEKSSCPLKAGTKYVYKDSFPILEFYPSISLKVHWALVESGKDIICFEVPARIS